MKEATCGWKDPQTGEVCGSTESVFPVIEFTGEVEIRDGPGWHEEIHDGRFVLRCPKHREMKIEEMKIEETEED